MAKWIVTRRIVDDWEVEAETGPEAVKKAQETYGEGAGDTAPAYYEAETEDGERPCELCGKPASLSDGEGVPFCRSCFDGAMEAAGRP